jgi:four helix bundle protein
LDRGIRRECSMLNVQFSISNMEIKNKYDLEDRLVEYSCRVMDVVEALPNTRAGNYIAGQLIKSCISPTFNYGEVQAAESRNDFIHKLGVVLKELKECRTPLKIIRKKEMIKPIKKTDEIFKETEELIAIIAKSIETAQKNRGKMA